jgi:hypothetical protein
MQNKIVTRGFGPIRNIPQTSALVVQGYGPLLPQFVVVALTEAQRPIRLRGGRSSAHRRLDQLDEVIIWAKLVDVNGQEGPVPNIKGWVKVKVDRTSRASALVEHVSTRVQSIFERIKVTVRLL